MLQQAPTCPGGRHTHTQDAASEVARVVDKRHQADRGVELAPQRAGSSILVALDMDGLVAGDATKEGVLHIGDDKRRAGYESLDADELVRICWRISGGGE